MNKTKTYSPQNLLSVETSVSRLNAESNFDFQEGNHTISMYFDINIILV